MNTTRRDSELLDEELQISHHVTVFPTTAIFPPTYPNVYSHFTIFFSNPSHKDQEINLSFKGDPYFEVSSPKVVIEGGSVYSCVITFIAKKPGSYNTILTGKIDGFDSCVVIIQASVNQSPLYFPEKDFSTFKFSDQNTKYQFQLRNNSIVQTLHVVLTTESPAFTISRPSIDLKPLAEEEIDLDFDSKLLGETEPKLQIQCAESGDSKTYPISIGTIRENIKIDFGVVSVGQYRSKSITAPNPILISSVVAPFAIEIADISETEMDLEENTENQREISVHFQPDEAGKFEEIIEFSNFFLEIKATAVESVFNVIPPKLPGQPALITNISNQPQECLISFSDNFDAANSTSVKLRPNETKEIDLDGSNNIFVGWGNQLTVIDHFDCFSENTVVLEKNTPKSSLKGKSSIPVTVSNTGNTPKRVSFVVDSPGFSVDEKYETLILEPQTMQSVDVSFTTGASKSGASLIVIDDDADEEITRVSLEAARPIIASASFIPLFRAQKNGVTSFRMAVSGAKRIEIDIPDWMDAPMDVSAGRKFQVSCRDIPSATVLDYIEFLAPNAATLSIPIFAYRGSSEISVKPPKIVKINSDGTRCAELKVVNGGLRAGFVAFTGTTNEETQQAPIRASPPSAIIQPGVIKTFKFVLSEEGPIRVAMHSGDEIMRQLRIKTRPDSFYAKAFEGIESRSEIELFTESIEKVNSKEFSKIFKKMLSINEVVFDNENNDEIDECLSMFADSPSIAVTEELVDFGSLPLGKRYTKSIWISNRSKNAIEVKTEFDAKNKAFGAPSLLSIRGGKQEKLSITFEPKRAGEYESELTLRAGFDAKTIGVVAKAEAPAAQADVVDFGNCAVGRLVRAKLRVSNKKPTASLEGRTRTPFILPRSRIEIGPNKSEFIPVHFVAPAPGAYQGTIEFTSSNGQPFTVELVAQAI